MSEPKIAPMTITPEEIPDKLYFRIGEVARLAGIKPYVLRFWETEFSALDPKKSGTGHRLYRRKEVQLVLEIKRLLYEKRYTIEGARKFLDSAGPRMATRPHRFQRVCRKDLPPSEPCQASRPKQVFSMFHHRCSKRCDKNCWKSLSY